MVIEVRSNPVPPHRSLVQNVVNTIQNYVMVGHLYRSLRTQFPSRSIHIVVPTEQDRDGLINVADFPPSVYQCIVTCQDTHDFRDLPDEDIVIQCLGL